jgi:hypothetical protein
MFLTNLLPQPSGCAWRTKVDGVIYADGTFEGDEKVVQGVQARRDGIVAAVQYWEDRMHRPNQNQTTSQLLEELENDAKRFSETDRRETMYPGCQQHPLSCEYWRGRQQVDTNAGLIAHLKKDDPEESYRRILQVMDGWQAKIEKNIALPKLDAVFPLPNEVADSIRSHNTEHKQ